MFLVKDNLFLKQALPIFNILVLEECRQKNFVEFKICFNNCMNTYKLGKPLQLSSKNVVNGRGGMFYASLMPFTAYE